MRLGTVALATLFLVIFVACVHPLVGVGGAALRIPMLIVGLVGLGATAGRWWALAFAFVPLLLVIVGVGYGPDVTDEGVPIFLVLGLVVFAPGIAAGVAARLIARRLRRPERPEQDSNLRPTP